MINEATAQRGFKYRVIGHAERFLDGINYSGPKVGSIGICKWASYRGICLKFPDKLGYIIPYDCLEEVAEKDVPAFRSVPTYETAIINQFRYRLAKLPAEGIQLVGKIGKICKIRWVSGMTGLAEVKFEDGDISVVSLTLLEDVGD